MDSPLSQLPPSINRVAHFVNVLFNRFYWEFMHQTYFQNIVKKKILNILDKLPQTYFISPPVLTNFELGKNPLKFTNVRQPFYDNKGLWLYFDVTYRGGIHLKCTTQIDLIKLKETAREMNAKKKEESKSNLQRNTASSDEK